MRSTLFLLLLACTLMARSTAAQTGDEATEAAETTPAPEPEEPIELPPPPENPRGDSTALAMAGYVVSGLAVVSLVTGIVTGAIALSEKGQAEESCSEADCQVASEEHERRALNFAHASTATFAVGGAALVVAIVLILVNPGDDSQTAFVGPGGVGLRF